MVQWKKNLLHVWIGQFLASTGFCFATPFIPFYVKELGVTDPTDASMWVALFAASGNLALFLSAPVWGFVADIYGRRPMVLRASFVCGSLMPLMAFVPNIACLVALRFVVGLFAGTVTAAQVLVSSNTPKKSRGFALGSLYSAFYAGTMAGTFLGGIVVDSFGYRCAFIASGLTLISGGIVVLLGVRESFQQTVSLGSRVRVIKVQFPSVGAAGPVLAIILLAGFAVRFDTPFMPILVETITGPDKAATWTGIIGSLAAVMGVLSGSFLGWIADRLPPRKIVMWSAGLAGLLMIPQGLASSLVELIPARLGMVFFAGGMASVLQVWLAKSTDDSQRGVIFGWATSIKSFGWFMGSLIAGGVAMHGGVRWVYFASAAAFIALVPATVAFTRCRRVLPGAIKESTAA